MTAIEQTEDQREPGSRPHDGRIRHTPWRVPDTAWCIAARSVALGESPLARSINGRPVVLYRDGDGRATALEDRCPHKNVALSLGRVRGGTLECRYHGWRFDPSGAVVEVPCRSPEERLPQCRVPSYRVVERDGWIWVRLETNQPEPAEPPAYPQDGRFYWFDLEYLVDAPVDLILENGLDCSHTGFAHEGLFRSAPSQFVTTRIEETATGVRATMLGERAGGARDTRARLGGDRVIRHVDEIVLPHTLNVDYAIGPNRLVTILVCTPETETRTRVFNRNGVCYGLWTPLVGRYVRRVARKVVQQDVDVLSSQAERIRRFGGRDFRNVTADQPAVWMQRVLTRCARGARPDPSRRAREIVYKL